MGKLTDGRSGTIAKAEPPEKGQRFIFDDHRDAPRGFGLRITSAGGKAFILKYRIEGRERRKTIGDWPSWSLEAARQEAHELIHKVGKGIDPLEEKRRRRAEPLFKELAAEYLERDAAGKKSERAIRGYVLNDLVPAIGNLRVSDLRRRDFIDVIETKAEQAPRAAANVLIYARRVMDYAADRDIIPANPLAGLKPASIKVPGIKDPLKAVHRERVLSNEEIRSFWANAETSGMHRLSALCLKLVLVTGQRPGEVAGIHSDEINGRRWVIPASRRGKTETAQDVYLTDTALDIIAAARIELDRLSKRRSDPPSGHVFEASPGGPIANTALARATERARGALGNADAPQWGYWTPHDLRRTMRTGLSACKARPDIAELTIGHTKKGLVKTYDQHAFYEERRAAMLAWEARLKTIVSGGDPDAMEGDDLTPDNVLAFGARA